MTIEGAIAGLQNLIDNKSIPIWAKPSLRAIKETVEQEIEERKPGKWKRGGYCCGETEWICPKCNASEWRTNRVPFCPWCGSPMEVDDGRSDERP